jgi:peptidoglycan biosynthesis protein MviN/MurJ (putative lipid II flippase)
LFRGTLLAGGIIAAAAGVGSLVPQLPLWIFGIPRSESTLALLRYMLWAMSPLSLAYIVMNYHMAQSRFKVLFLLPVCAVFYLAGAAIWHASVFQIVAVMAACNLAGLAVLLIGLPWKNLEPADGAAPAVERVGQA